MNLKIVRTSYLLGISLLLASILYFFASNWQTIDRFMKIILIILLLFLFYGLYFLFKKIFIHHFFVSNWMLIAASLVFGIAVALIGQIYNSHADSYQLFIIWLIPVLILAIFTRYQPFDVMSFVLAHLAMFFFLSPANYFQEWTDNELLFLLFAIMCINAVLFLLCYTSKIHSTIIQYAPFIMFHSIFLFIYILDLPFHFITNFLYMILLVVMLYYLLKIKPSRPLFMITGIFAGLYTFYKIITWVFDHYGYITLFILLFFAFSFVLLSITVIGIMKKGKFNRLLTDFITITVTIISSLFAAIAISGLFYILLPDISSDVLFFFALIACIIPGLSIKMSDLIRFPLLVTGFMIAFAVKLLMENTLYNIILFTVLCIGFYIVKMIGIRVLLFIFINITAIHMLTDLFTFEIAMAVMFLSNALFFILIKNQQATQYTALIIGFTDLLILTMLDTISWLHLTYNLGYFMIATSILLFMNRKDRKGEWTIALIFWFIFIAYTYYEYLWTLIHKSLLFLVLGLLLIGVAYYFDKKLMHSVGGYKIRYTLPLLIAVLILQLSFIGYQVISSEKLLNEGKLIKLEIEPVDPRSVLQGDYIQFRFSITDLGSEINEASLYRKKIKVVLREKDGFYQYGGYYKVDGKWNKSYEKQKNDVIINGTIHHQHEITYGIENYFVEEGVGHELEENAEVLFVRVGKNGNAMIEGIE